MDDLSKPRGHRTVRFTDRWLSALEAPETGSIEYFDAHRSCPPGFGLRVFASGVKSFFLVYRRGGRKRRYTFGQYPSKSLAKARSAARTLADNEWDPMALKEHAREVGGFATVARSWAEQATKAHNEPLSPRTLAEYQRVVQNVILRDKRFDQLFADVSSDDVELFLANEARRSPEGANRCFQALRNVYRFAEKRKHITRAANFMLVMEKPAGRSKPRDRVLDRNEIRAVWNELGKETLVIGAYFRLLFFCATRKTETLTARWEHIRADSRVWAIPAADTKSGQPHEVPLPGPAWRLLDALGTIGGRSGWIFPGAKTGQHLVNPHDAKDRIQKRSGVSFRIHDIRRTVATSMARLGVRPDVISAVLSHAHGERVTRIYDRWARLPEQRAALDQWGAELERIISGEEASVVEFRR